MSDRFSIKTWQERYEKGEFSSPDFDTQVKAGWYDWFCDSDLLEAKTHRFAKVIMKLQNSKRINLEKNYVLFCNNCPFDFPLYDDLRISDMETGKGTYVITRKDPFDEDKNLWNVSALGEKLVLGKEGPTHKRYSFETTKDLIKWLNEV